MKYARRSVSDQDIRRYEMFSQVRFIFSAYHPCTEPSFAEPTTIPWIWEQLQVPGERRPSWP